MVTPVIQAKQDPDLAGRLAACTLCALLLPHCRSWVSICCMPVLLTSSFVHIQHKSPIVEELEDRLRALGERRARAAAQRTEADNEEEERPANAAVKAAMGVIGRGGAMPGAVRLSGVLLTQHPELRTCKKLSTAGLMLKSPCGLL